MVSFHHSCSPVVTGCAKAGYSARVGNPADFLHQDLDSGHFLAAVFPALFTWLACNTLCTLLHVLLVSFRFFVIDGLWQEKRPGLS